MTLYLPSTFAANTAFASAVAASTASMSPLLPPPRLYQFAFMVACGPCGHGGVRAMWGGVRVTWGGVRVV